MDYQEAFEYMRKEAHRQTVNSEGQDAYIIAISAMLELQEYKKLGALEEVRESVERQQAKQVINISKGDELRFGTCPICNRRISNVEGGNYCQNCGQHIDWSDEV